MGIIIAILIFCLLIITHELGHLLVAKLNGIYCYEFSMGMGPKLFAWKKGETEYFLRAFPIGGMVRMMGEDEQSDDPRAFNQKSVARRMAVVAAGPLMNLLCACLIFVVSFMFIGVAANVNVVGDVMAGQAAEAAGMQPGDTILAINGQQIAAWNDISAAVAAVPAGSELEVLVEREGEQQELTIIPFYDEASGRYLMGITASTQKLGFFAAVNLGISQSVELTVLIIKTLFGMITGSVPVDLSGPVGVVSVVGQTAQSGLANLLFLTGFLCVNIGIFNLLPIPALDGSRLVFLAIEGIRKKPIDPQKEGMVHLIGLALLMLLMVVVTYQDIVRLFN